MRLVKTHEPSGKITKGELEEFLRSFIAMGVRCAEVDNWQSNYKTKEGVRNTFTGKSKRLHLPIKVKTRGDRAYIVNTSMPKENEEPEIKAEQ